MASLKKTVDYLQSIVGQEYVGKIVTQHIVDNLKDEKLIYQLSSHTTATFNCSNDVSYFNKKDNLDWKEFAKDSKSVTEDEHNILLNTSLFMGKSSDTRIRFAWKN